MIIGIGTHTGGDDQAGLLVAHRLRELSVEAVDYSGELLRLIDLWEGADKVILVDAMRSGGPPGTIRVIEWPGVPFAGDQLPVSTHGLGLFEVLSLAAELERLPQRVTIYGIEGKEFEPGSSPSPEVLNAVEELAQRLAREVSGCTNPA
jgi:hydrogenase maturation protease